MVKNVDFIVCAYAVDKKYWDFADRLEYGLKKFDIEYDIERWKKKKPVDNFRNIQLYKPHFVKEKLKKYKKPIMYVDVDTVFLGKPKIPKVSFDVGVTLRLNGRGLNFGMRCWNFCTIWNWTYKSYNVLNLWELYCDNDNFIDCKNRRDHFRLSLAQEEVDYEELILNDYLNEFMLGYTERGDKRRIINKENITSTNRKKLIDKEEKIYNRRH